MPGAEAQGTAKDFVSSRGNVMAPVLNHLISQRGVISDQVRTRVETHPEWGLP
jgi:hypothetical protein